MRGKSGFVVVTVAVGSVALSACGSSGSGTSTTANSTGKSSGGSVNVGVIAGITGATASPEIGDAFKAAMSQLNASGGIGGKQINVETCDTTFQPNVSASCWRKFTADKSIVAIYTADTFTDASTSLIDNAKVLTFAGPAGSKFETADPNAYKVDAGLAAVFQSTAQLAVSKGMKKPAILGYSIPQAQPLASIEKAIVSSAGGSVSKYVQIDPATVDLSTSVAQMLSAKPDGLILNLPTPGATKAIQAARSQGFTGPIATGLQPWTDTQLGQLGKDGDGIVGAQLMPPASETQVPTAGLKAFNDAMAKYFPNAVRDDLAVTAYASALAVAAAIKAASTVDRAGVLAAIATVKNFTADGILPKFDFTKPGPVKGMPTVTNPYTIWITVKDGKKVWDGKWHSIVDGSTVAALSS